MVVLTADSEGAEGGERHQDTLGRGEGVFRLVSSPQISFGRPQRARQTLRGQATPHRFYLRLTVVQQYKDVKEKAEQLAPWLRKLKDNVTTVDIVDPEEKKRRAELSR